MIESFEWRTWLCSAIIGRARQLVVQLLKEESPFFDIFCQPLPTKKHNARNSWSWSQSEPQETARSVRLGFLCLPLGIHINAFDWITRLLASCLFKTVHSKPMRDIQIARCTRINNGVQDRDPSGTGDNGLGLSIGRNVTNESRLRPAVRCDALPEALMSVLGVNA